MQKLESTQLVTFRAGEIAPALSERLANYPVGGIARRDLERYYALLVEELATVTLSENEALLICDALNGTLMLPQTMRLLWAEIDDSIRLDATDEKWQVDGPALVEKLRRFTSGQTLAVVDAGERWWNRNEIDEDPRERLRIVGLVHDPSR